MRAAGKRSETDEALVLRTTDVGEADRIVVLLAREHGRVEAVARGARRMRSRFGSALEPLSRVRAVWRQQPGRELGRLLEAELLGSAYGVLTEPRAFESLARTIRLVETVTLAGHASPELFRLVVALVEAATPAPGDPGRLARLACYAEVWISRLEGFWPDLEHCSGCFKPLRGTRQVSAGTGGALCQACARGQTGCLPMGDEAVCFARAIQVHPPQKLADSDFAGRASAELGRFTAALLSYHLERDFRSQPVERT